MNNEPRRPWPFPTRDPRPVPVPADRPKVGWFFLLAMIVLFVSDLAGCGGGGGDVPEATPLTPPPIIAPAAELPPESSEVTIPPPPIPVTTEARAFLRELIVALEAMPDRSLGRGYFENHLGSRCALGVLAEARGMDAYSLNGGTPPLSDIFHVDQELAVQVIMVNDTFMGDDHARWQVVHDWAVRGTL